MSSVHKRLESIIYGDDHPYMVWSLLLLTIGSGLIDAFCLVQLGHVFVANMTGNFVFLSLSLTPNNMDSPALSLLAICGYCVAAFGTGRLERRLSPRSKLILLSATECIFLFAAIVLWGYIQHIFL